MTSHNRVYQKINVANREGVEELEIRDVTSRKKAKHSEGKWQTASLDSKT